MMVALLLAPFAVLQHIGLILFVTAVQVLALFLAILVLPYLAVLQHIVSILFVSALLKGPNQA